jgi:hypothetical protein
MINENLRYGMTAEVFFNLILKLLLFKPYFSTCTERSIYTLYIA